MRGTEWLIVDTETDGLMDPIHVVEIAAQRMNGWEPVGERFRVLLNHNVPIPPAAVAVHGYTEEFLRRHGEKPHVAHAQFHDFAQGLPIVAHNLSFDWNRALEPEWRRLGLAPAAQRGFCSLMLSRRVVDGARSYSLDALREMFSISTNHAHRAFGDVDAVVELFTHVFRPKLEGAGIDSFDGVMEFACKTPVAKCLCQFRVQPANSGSGGKAEGLDSWYFIDGQNESRGPLRATEIVALTGGVACWVWQDGMADWVSSENHQAFLEALQKPNAKTPRGRARARRNPASKVEELKTICGDILKDGVVTTEEVVQLAQWLEQAGEINEWPATEIAQALESILMDGAVTDEERKELQVLLERANENGSPAGCDAGASPNETPLLPVTKVELTCVGNAGSGYLQTQIRVVWFEVLVNKERRWVDVIEHDLPIKSHRRENRINYCTYEIPEGVVCFFERYVQTKPRVHERKFFQMLDGEFKDLGEGVQFDFVARFLGEYEGWNVCVGQNREDLREMRGQSADEETRESMGLFETTATIRVNEARAEPAKPAELQSNPGQFSVVELTQGTQEWLQWRQEGIGASDAQPSWEKTLGRRLRT